MIDKDNIPNRFERVVDAEALMTELQKFQV